MNCPHPSWLHEIVHSPTLNALCEAVTQHTRIVALGSRGSSTSILTGALAIRTGRPVLLVVAHVDDADDALEDLDLFRLVGSNLSLLRFAALEVLPGESATSLELVAERLSVVGKVVSHAGETDPVFGVMVAPVQALMQAVPEPQALGAYTLHIVKGQSLPLGRLAQWLTDAGYQRVEVVEQPGDFASRGGIVDIYPPAFTTDVDGAPGRNKACPIRLDYLGDEIDSIHLIDLDTMGSGTALQEARIIGTGLGQIQSDQHTTSLLSLLPADTLVVLYETLEIAEQARGYYERLTNARGMYSPQAVLKALTGRPHVEVDSYSHAGAGDRSFELPVSPLLEFDQDAAKSTRELCRLAQPRTGETTPARVVVLCTKPAERDRLTELIYEHAPAMRASIQFEIGYLHRGFVWSTDETHTIHLVPHHEIFHRYSTCGRARAASFGTRTRSPSESRVKETFLDLQAGDYAVHVDHGIARFAGLVTMRRKGRTEEYLTLEFANQARLHVPVMQIDLVQKYIGGFQGKPPLSLLGGKRWSRQKQRVAEAVKDLAAEMLRIQAARASLPGIRYPSDTTWQREFEAEFPYDETEDQLAAVVEVKKDMTDPQPMDRLICGDVGFGKTEVAVRAAFKAAEFGKQVAVLVPTTVLAEQHERTFRERMADYPFRVESLSRFKTGSETARVLKDLAQGGVDIVIGTHRLISDDVQFANLGLVIIDEEQRFGVEHKQKLMKLRVTVDVLTLSATPIPRTLHMSMLGLRDISSLSTPPPSRRAIVTEVIPHDSRRIQQAIVRELNRDGQVYFVHNRVHDIQSVADDIQKLVPQARLAIGHGQMHAHELEKVMLRFLRREVDVLVCTTIIESGLDIPTANTIFIDQADHFGLADLHQLRGRVGRYKHRAYCYLLLPPDRPVTDSSTKRLKAIEQYSMLGAGFKIAMRDLEIRGAGNLLGAEQSGHIATVGYEMYCQLLEQAARRLRHEQITEPVGTHVELPLSAYLPKRYIESDKHRMDAYRRVCSAESLDVLRSVVQDLTDAYGSLPTPAADFVELMELKVISSKQDITGIKLEGPDVIFRTFNPQRLEAYLANTTGRASIVDAGTVYYRLPPRDLEPHALMAVLKKVLSARRDAHQADSGGTKQMF
jgi:transcription-repair coupling factor (superfamily II helicase)